MLQLLLKQPIHIWRILGRRQKIEVILLSGLVYIYLSDRLRQYFESMIQYGAMSPFGLTDLMTHLFIFAAIVSGPFIFMYLVPRQKGLKPFYGQPLSPNELSAVIIYFSQKYQIILAILFLPVITALIFSAGLIITAYALVLFVIFYSLFFIFTLELLFRIKTQKMYLTTTTLLTAGYSGLYMVTFYLGFYTIISDVLLLFLILIMIFRFHPANKSVNLELIFPATALSFSQKEAGSLTFRNIPGIFPALIQTLFNKELLGLWRNPKYRRLKFFTYFGYTAGLIFMYTLDMKNADMWMTLWALTIVWLHYSNSFNDKYVLPDPDWYFHTLPFRFYQIWLAKFMVEFIYIIVITATYWIFLLIIKTPFAGQLNLIGVLLIFSIMILSAMLNFQIMFYDEPRLAGFAYHFTVIFIVILFLNDRLIGPVIGVGLLLFYFYKSRRFFNS
ncbi:MAG: hypothetical protein AB7T22_00965 [Calditrichaceae bacterium]